MLNPTIKAESKKLSANQNLCENYIIFRKNLVKNQAKSLVHVLQNIGLICFVSHSKKRKKQVKTLRHCRHKGEKYLCNNNIIKIAFMQTQKCNFTDHFF